MARQNLQIVLDVLYKGRGGIRNAQNDLQRLDTTAEKAKRGWSSMLPGLTAVGIGLGGVAVAARGAWQALEGGAALLETQGKFDRLTESIGTTGEALKTDLGANIGLLMTQSEQMGLATELMSLGLAKTHDETVRLASAASQLGWNLNMLTLTIANKSLMRLDSLGLAADVVKEKIEGFKAAGMSADDAFKWALIESAEAKVKLLGNKSDTAAGQLDSLKNAAKDAYDQLMIDFATVTIKHMQDTGVSADDLAVKMLDLAGAAATAWANVMGAISATGGQITGGDELFGPFAIDQGYIQGVIKKTQIMNAAKALGWENPLILPLGSDNAAVRDARRYAPAVVPGQPYQQYSTMGMPGDSSSPYTGIIGRGLTSYGPEIPGSGVINRDPMSLLNNEMKSFSDNLKDYDRAQLAANEAAEEGARVFGSGGGLTSSIQEAEQAILNLNAASGDIFGGLYGKKDFNLAEEIFGMGGQGAASMAEFGIASGLFDEAKANEMLNQTFLMQNAQQLLGAGMRGAQLWEALQNLQGQLGEGSTLAQDFFADLEQQEMELGLGTERMTTELEVWAVAMSEQIVIRPQIVIPGYDPNAGTIEENKIDEAIGGTGE